MISMIWAMDRNCTIGKDNKLPWRLPADLANFKRLTTGHTVIMGRKTFESLGKSLKDRKNVIMTRDLNYSAEGCVVCHTVEEILEMGRDEEVFVIGGADIYSEFLPFSEKLYVTLIDENFSGDTFFPAINDKEWMLISSTQGEKNEKNPYNYYFLIHERIKIDK